MKYWTAECSSCGTVKIAQKTKPTTCKEKKRTGERSIRLCANLLTDHKNVTLAVEAALDAAQ